MPWALLALPMKLKFSLLTLLSVVGFSSLGCSSTYEPATGVLEQDLLHRDPQVRLQAILITEKESRRDLSHFLVSNLTHNDIIVRMISNTALKRLSGEDFNFQAHLAPYERHQAIRRWIAWLKDEGFLPSEKFIDDFIPLIEIEEPKVPLEEEKLPWQI